MYLPPKTDGDFAPPPEGTHSARCYRVVDLGTQQVDWQGQAKLQRKIVVSWEIPTELMEDGRPFTIHSRYTFSSSEKSNFRKHLESWRGKRFEETDFGQGGFDIRNLIGVPCLLTVVHNRSNETTYANVGAVVRVPKEMKVPGPINPTTFLSLERQEFDQEVFDTLSDGMKETIKRSPEYGEIIGTPPCQQDSGYNEGHDLDDDIPF